MAVSLAYLTAANLFSFAATALSAALSGVLFTNAIINDLKNGLIEINENGTIEMNHVQATKQLCDFIQADTLVKQLSQFPIQTIYQWSKNCIYSESHYFYPNFIVTAHWLKSL